jgi:hypothetical protein
MIRESNSNRIVLQKRKIASINGETKNTPPHKKMKAPKKGMLLQEPTNADEDSGLVAKSRTTTKRTKVIFITFSKGSTQRSFGVRNMSAINTIWVHCLGEERNPYWLVSFWLWLELGECNATRR